MKLPPAKLLKKIEEEVDEIIVYLMDGTKKDEVTVTGLVFKIAWIKTLIEGKGEISNPKRTSDLPQEILKARDDTRV